MLVSLKEMKRYLRVDFDEDDSLLRSLIATAERLCLDVLRTDDVLQLKISKKGKFAVLYAVAYLYEHREEANHRKLTLTLRALLGADRKEGF